MPTDAKEIVGIIHFSIRILKLLHAQRVVHTRMQTTRLGGGEYVFLVGGLSSVIATESGEVIGIEDVGLGFGVGEAVVDVDDPGVVAAGLVGFERWDHGRYVLRVLETAGGGYVGIP